MANGYPLVIVVWDDAWGDATKGVAPQDAKDEHRPTVMQTIGWLLVDDEKGLSIFNERCLDKGDDYYRSRTFIPRAMVKSVTKFNLSRPRKPRHAKTVPSPAEPAG